MMDVSTHRAMSGWHPNTDCSEIAEEMQQALGGRIATFASIRPDGLILPIRCILGDGVCHEFKYHCVLIVNTLDDGELVVDAGGHQPVMRLAAYIMYLKQLNEGIIVVKTGDWANFMLGARAVSPIDGFKAV